jgi:hypothetical protein
MLKSIKKSIKYLIILIGIIILTPSFFYLIIRIPDVQTFVVKRITSHFSDQIKSTITLGKLEYNFFNRLLINDVLIKDIHNDTMLYASKVTLGLRRLDFRNKILAFGRANITSPDVAIITDSAGITNLNWYLDLFGKSPGQNKKSNSRITISQINIEDGKFHLRNYGRSESKTIIDFNDLRVAEINGTIENFRVQNDSTEFKIRDLQFKESNGLNLRQMNSSVLLASHDFFFNDLFLETDSSVIHASHLSLMADSADSFQRFVNEVRLDVNLQKSVIGSGDLRYFVPGLDGLSQLVGISGRVTGTVSELKGRDIRLTYGKISHLDCDFDFSGLPDIKNAFIFIGVHTLTTNSDDIEKFRPKSNDNFEFPVVLQKLGDITFNGSFTGFFNDFVAYGNCSTREGEMMVDLSLRPEEKNMFRIKGLIKGSSIALGDLTEKPDLLGNVSMETNIDGYISSARKVAGSITGRIDSIDINHYKYRQIELSGTFTEKTWDGSIKVSDKNISLDLLGMFDFRNTLPEFDFTLNLAHSDLFNLNVDKTDTTARLAMLLTANFKGNNIDNLYGEIKMLNSTFRKYNNNLELYNFSLKAFTENNKPAISLRTDFVDADLRGYYNFADISVILKKILASLLPARFKSPKTNMGQIKNDFTFLVNFKNTDKINDFFRTGILLADKSAITGSFFPDSLIKLGFTSRKFSYGKYSLSDLSLMADFADSTLRTSLTGSSLSLLGQTTLKDFDMKLDAIPGNFLLRAEWDNKEKQITKGNLAARGSLQDRIGGVSGSILKIQIDSSEVFVRNKLWKISQSDIAIDSTAIMIDNFSAVSATGYYLINGKITENPDDTLTFKFKGIDLGYLSDLGGKSEGNNSSGIELDLKGIIDGNVSVSNALKNPLVQSNITLKGFSLLGGQYGDVSILSAWNPTKKVADLYASNNLNGTKNLDVIGFYDPDSKKIDLTVQTTKLPVEALNPLLSSFATDITGSASGKLRLSGTINQPVLSGSIYAENTSIKIDYLQTSYIINDTIRFDNEGIKFRNLKFVDEKGKTATLTGAIYHKSFKDFMVDLTISMNDCLVLNTQAKDNNMFYGIANATGVATIKSGQNSLSFDISGTTEKNTRVLIPLNSGLSVSEYSFVTFVNYDTLKNENLKQSVPGQSSASRTSIELNIDLNVTPDAEIQLLIDPKAGDVIRGRGEGQLNISLNKEGVFKIIGDYTIDQGDYLFTLGNIFNKRFDVENGGKITFNGDVENAEIDLKASYKNLRTSLYPILQDERYNERITVEPQINLTGKLFNPLVSFDIYLPNADEETKAYLKNAITTEEEMSRQFLFLLVMNSFYSDPSYRASESNAVAGSSAMAVTTSEMLSNQLSNWLSQISKDFDVGFRYTPGNKNINSQEVQVALSTQLLNDKVQINGNFDVRGANNPSGNPITGDFEIEYKITEKIRFKVFNRYNNPYTGRGVPYTQGLGLFYKQDFDKLSDLLKKKGKSDAKKEEEVRVK